MVHDAADGVDVDAVVGRIVERIGGRRLVTVDVRLVAATNRNDQLAWFSNYGATTVDLAADAQ